MNHGWSLQIDRWRRVREDCNRFSPWRTTPFLLVNSARVPSSSGVYALCAPSNRPTAPRHLLDAIYSPIYIGRSDDLRRRFIEHIRRPQPLIDEAVRTFSGLDYWYCVVDEHQTASFEAQLIDCLGPSANRIRGLVATLGPAQPA